MIEIKPDQLKQYVGRDIICKMGDKEVLLHIKDIKGSKIEATKITPQRVWYDLFDDKMANTKYYINE